MSITLHAKLGVNPRIEEFYCPACGKAHSDGAVIALLGSSNYYEVCAGCGVRVYGGVSHCKPCPKCDCREGRDRHMLEDWERIPGGWKMCDDCAKQAKEHDGVWLVSVRDGESGKGNPYRTGRACLIKREALERIGGKPVSASGPKVMYVEDSVWTKVGLPA